MNNEAVEFIRSFNRLNRGDVAIAGGKGASLGEMTQAGIPVPPGFIILSDAFERFLEEADLKQEIDTIIIHGVNREEMHTVEHASEEIQHLILAAKMPEDIAREIVSQFRALDAQFVAVRSSATAEDSLSAAWAGQLDTFLNTTEDDLLQNVQKCWASLFTSRAIFYRFEKNLHTTSISVAVVVQKMVQSEVSGIAFSVHPVTEDRNQLIIEAGFGLGEAIVSGQVTPDSYVVEKNPRRIIDVNVSTQTRALYRSEGEGNEWRDIAEPRASSQVLGETQILELSEIVLRIENHYGFPCDIEWAFEAGNFYITQSRPITTLQDSRFMMNIFEKTIERDATFFMQGLFAIVMSGENYLSFGKNNPYKPLYVSYFTGENIQLWEHRAAVDWILDQLLEKNQSADFLRALLDDQHVVHEQLHAIWNNSSPTFDSDAYMDLASRSMLNVSLAYYAGMDGRTPPSAKQLAIESRKDDDFFARGDEYIRAILAKEGYTHERANLILPGEISRLPSFETVNQRMRGAVLINGTEFVIGSLQEYVQMHPEYCFTDLVTSTEKTDELKGQIASRGIISGRVRIVKNKSQMAAVENGDILVSPMTTPDFMPAMQMAAAFVTDEGGIVCHAAIVAREMKKPCIIGTKIATQMLKDGDMVEVDANTGIVRKL